MRNKFLLIAGTASALSLASGGCSLFGGQSESADSESMDSDESIAQASPAMEDSGFSAMTASAQSEEMAPERAQIDLVNGRLETIESASLASSYDAALGAIEAMEFELKKHASNGSEARVLSERSNGDAIILRMFADGDQTRIAIRVGASGDQDASNQLLDEIRSRLSSSQFAQAQEPAESLAMDSQREGAMESAGAMQIVELESERFEIERADDASEEGSEFASVEESEPDY